MQIPAIIKILNKQLSCAHSVEILPLRHCKFFSFAQLQMKKKGFFYVLKPFICHHEHVHVSDI